MLVLPSIILGKLTAGLNGCATANKSMELTQAYRAEKKARMTDTRKI
jgi:hypothetical protein